MISNKISIRGCKVHNLKNIDLDIPRNKLVIVTAGSKGIGKSIVNAFLDAGARVATFSRNCKSQKDDTLFQLQGDISDPDFLNHFHSSLTTYFDASVDILVNNNGGPTPGLPLSFDDKDDAI